MTVYAVIETCGKQFKVSHNDIIKIDQISGEVGEMIDFNQIHLLNTGEELKIGEKDCSNALVRGRIIAQEKDKKIIVFKFKRRKGYKKKQGHRQLITRVLIKEILYNSQNLTPEIKKEKLPEKIEEVNQETLPETGSEIKGKKTKKMDREIVSEKKEAKITSTKSQNKKIKDASPSKKKDKKDK
jgi:large subunit ribosomal protein L21